MRATALRNWADLFLVQPELTLAGHVLLNCGSDERKVVSTFLEDLFRKKATSTLQA